MATTINFNVSRAILQRNFSTWIYIGKVVKLSCIHKVHQKSITSNSCFLLILLERVQILKNKTLEQKNLTDQYSF